MTKNLVRVEIDKYVHTLNVCFKDGRSDKAPEVLAFNLFLEVCSSELAACKKNVKKDLLQKNVAEQNLGKGVRDKWCVQGDVMRIYHRCRRRLCTPLDGRPDDSIQDMPLQGQRVTQGFFEDGSSFSLQDSWTHPRQAHHVTAKPWTGVSMFMRVPLRPESARETQSEGECQRHRLSQHS